MSLVAETGDEDEAASAQRFHVCSCSVDAEEREDISQQLFLLIGLKLSGRNCDN